MDSAKRLFAFAPLGAQEPKKDAPAPKKEATKDYEETILSHFKKPSDTTSLIAYLKERSASDDDWQSVIETMLSLANETT